MTTKSTFSTSLTYDGTEGLTVIANSWQDVFTAYAACGYDDCTWEKTTGTTLPTDCVVTNATGFVSINTTACGPLTTKYWMKCGPEPDHRYFSNQVNIKILSGKCGPPVVFEKVLFDLNEEQYAASNTNVYTKNTFVSNFITHSGSDECELTTCTLVNATSTTCDLNTPSTLSYVEWNQTGQAIDFKMDTTAA